MCYSLLYKMELDGGILYNGMSEGKMLKEELTAEIVDANTFKFSDVVSIDGQTSQTLNVEMHKVKG